MRRSKTLTFTAIETNKTIDVEADVGPVAPTMTALFEAVGDGTRVTFQCNPNAKGPLKLSSPLVAKQGRRVWNARVAGLETALEKSAS